MKPPLADHGRREALRLFERSGMTRRERGRKMGDEAGAARRAAWQLFNKVGDPRPSTTERLGARPTDLL